MLNGGVIVWNERLLVYRREPSDWFAQYLGDDQPIAITDALRSAIDADQRHQDEKHQDDAQA